MNQRNHYDILKVQKMLDVECETDKKLEQVVTKIAHIEQNLKLVNANYVTISDMLTDCEFELEACTKECSGFLEKLLKFTAEIFPKSNSIIEQLFKAGATIIGTTVGVMATVVSLLSGPVALIAVPIGTLCTVGWTAGWLNIWRDESEIVQPTNVVK